MAPWAAAAAGVVVALAALYGYRAERSVRALLSGELEEALVTRMDLQASVEARDSILAILTAPTLLTTTLGTPGTPPAARLHWDPARRVAVVAAFRLQPPGPGRTYQLWSIASDREPVSMGTFTPAADGTGVAILPASPGADLRSAAVTEEAEGGAAVPTGEPVLVGTLPEG